MSVDEHTRSPSLSPLASDREREITRPGADTERSPGATNAAVEDTADELPPGTALGRYMILRRVGAGAMGVVYAAFDPELDRKVAIKLLHPRGSGATHDHRARLLREAKALARLSHPNVVAVHDVGTYGDRIFLAMEFLAGVTLTTWLKTSPRRWREVVDILARAGEGLAAAHEAGLVHRDFKPDNVLIADDGRVRVLDFGLARTASDAPDAPGAVDPTTLALLSASGSRRTPDHALAEALLTRTGALVGTPAYMSPEQHLGQGVDARSDQFSFCVTLYQALYGVRPFQAAKLSALAFQVIQGKVQAAPAGAAVPAWLRKLLLRGLAVDPNARHPSMRLLVDALRRDRSLTRRGGAWAGLGGLGLGAGLWLASSTSTPLCQGGAAKLAGIWDEARSAAVAEAFLAVDLPYAARSWESVRVALDAYADAWAGAFNDACAATEIRREQSPELLDRRVRCLERRRTRLGALVEVLARPTAGTVEHATALISDLGDLTACADADALLALVPPPEDPERVHTLQVQLGTASALELTGDLKEAGELSRNAVRAAAEIDYGPLIADALIVRAHVQRRLGAGDAAITSLGEAVHAAARGRDDRLAAAAWIDLLFHVGQEHPEAGRLDALRGAAEAALARIGDDPSLRAGLDHASATGLLRLGRYEDALAPARRAATALGLAPDRDPARAHQAYCTLALVQQALHHYDEARAAFERALALAQRVSGADHPSAATLMNNLAELLLEASPEDPAGLASAEEYARRAEEIRGRILPKTHHELAESAQTRARLAEARGDLAAAQAHNEHAISIYRASPTRDPRLLSSALNDLSLLALKRDDLARARDLSREAFGLLRASLGDEHPYTRAVEGNIAMQARWLGQPLEALAIHTRLLALAERADPRSLESAEAHSELAQTLLALGRVAEARAHLEQAREIFDGAAKDPALDPLSPAIARAALARALAAEAHDAPRQRALILAAEPVLRAAAETRPEARRALAELAALRPREG